MIKPWAHGGLRRLLPERYAAPDAGRSARRRSHPAVGGGQRAASQRAAPGPGTPQAPRPEWAEGL